MAMFSNVLLLTCLFFLFLFLFLCYFFSFFLGGTILDKGSSFECGFQPFGSLSFSFSMPFFLVSLMFLLFDVEILLLCFYPLTPSFGFFPSLVVWFLLFFIFFVTAYEWGSGVFVWVWV